VSKEPYRPDNGGRYGLLLLVLILTYLLSAFNLRLADNLDIVLFAVVLLLALRTSALPRRWIAVDGVASVIGSALIYGALSAYIIVGLMFAACYAAIEHLDPAPFFADGQPAGTQTLQYFSFTTLTTLGYGDFTAAGDGGRALAVIEALTGQVFLAMLVARLVAAYRQPTERAQPKGSQRRSPGASGNGAARRRRRNTPEGMRRSVPRAGPRSAPPS
jgi:Ion channel